MSPFGRRSRFTVRHDASILLSSDTIVAKSDGISTGVQAFKYNSRSQSFHLGRLLPTGELSRGHERRSKPAHRQFASITANIWARLSGTGDIRRTFNMIDSEGKGFVTVGDLENYARANGLPPSYASNFVSAALSSPSHAAAVTASTEVSYREFSNFVRARESALRKAFDLFDKDNDGHISMEDLEASLRHVTVACPASRCIYRCNRRGTIARELFAQAQGSGSGSKLEFSQFRSFFLLLPQNELLVDYWLNSGRCPDLDTKVLLHESQDASKASPWGHLVAGALAGAASRTATAPLETLRLAVMTGSLEAADLMQGATLLMARGGGWQALFRGNAVNVMRSAPSKALDFFAFDSFKKLLGDSGGGYLQTFAAAGLAGATSWTLLYPLEVVRSRITCGSAPAEAGNNVIKVMRSIVGAEGVRALYRGLGWSVAAIVPEAAICYGLHDLLKRTYKQVNNADPDVLTGLSFGVISAFTGQLVAYPLETVSRRLQVSGLPMTHVLGDLLSQGGLKAFYRGVGASILRLVPMACISFGTYEVVRSALVQLEELKVDAECSMAARQHCMPRQQQQRRQGQQQAAGSEVSLAAVCSIGVGSGEVVAISGTCSNPCSSSRSGAEDGCAKQLPGSCCDIPAGGLSSLCEGSTGLSASLGCSGPAGALGGRVMVFCDAEAAAAGLCQPSAEAAVPPAAA